MEIIYLRKTIELERFNQNLKIGPKKCHCLYFRNTKKDENKLINNLKFDISFPSDFVVDKKEFKKQYLNLIGCLTSTFSNKYWWATETVSKFRSQLPFFLYKFQIVLSLIKRHNPEILIIVDKELIFERLLHYYSQENKIKFTSSFKNFRKLVYVFNINCRFYFKILKSFFGLIYKLIISKYFFNKELKNQNISQNHVIIKSFSYVRSFKNNNEYVDQFFGNLSSFLKRRKKNILTVVSCIGNYKIIVKKLKKLDDMIYPYELFISPIALIITFFEVLKFRMIVKEDVLFNKINMSNFLSEYLFLNRVNELSLNQILYYQSMKGMLKIFKAEKLISTYENIPWEPMCFLGVKTFSPETEIIGYQHSVVSDFSTNYFLHDTELKNRPLPDKILTVGATTKKIIEMNSGKILPPIQSSCALRYNYLKERKIESNKNNKILVVLEGLNDVYKLVNYVLSEISENDNLEIIIRPHPILPMSELDKYINKDYKKLEYVKISSNDSVLSDLENVSAVIYRESTVALEAISLGIPVICFRSHQNISYDPLFELNDFKWNVDESVKLKLILDEIFNLNKQVYNSSKKQAKLYINNYFENCTDHKMSLFINA